MLFVVCRAWLIERARTARLRRAIKEALSEFPELVGHGADEWGPYFDDIEKHLRGAVDA